MYSTLELSEPLSQGDIVDQCPIFGLPVTGSTVDPGAEPSRWLERVLILTQACDLAQVKTTKVVVALVHPAQTLVDQGVLKAAAVRDQVRRGLVHG